MQAGIARSLLDGRDPFFFFFQLVQVVDASLIGKDEHEGVQSLSVFVNLLQLLLEVDSRQTLHFLVLQVALLLVAV